MKAIIIAIVVLVLAFAGWQLLAPEADSDMENGDNTEIMEGDDTVNGDDSTGLEVDPNAKVFNLTGKNFAFSQTEIRVEEGDTVTINFSATEGMHDWVVDEFDAKTAQVRSSDGVTSVTFVADEAGEFEYYCSVGDHRSLGMVGTLIVE